MSVIKNVSKRMTTDFKAFLLLLIIPQILAPLRTFPPPSPEARGIGIPLIRPRLRSQGCQATPDITGTPKLHASPEKANVAPSSDFRPDNDDDEDENTNRAKPSVNEFGLVKDQKEKDKKGANETFIFVRPPPSKTNHPLNLQVQLVPPNSRGPSGLTPTGTVNTPVTATPARQSFDANQPRRQGTDDSANELTRTSTNRSDVSTSIYSGYSSVSSFSSVASTSTSASSQPGRRTIIPLYNLQAHNVMTNTIVDAGTDAKIAKFQKRGLEMIGLAMLEPVEVWPTNNVPNETRRPPHNGSGLLHPQQDRPSRPVTPTVSEDLHGHTPTSSRLSVSSAGIDSTSHHQPNKGGYPIGTEYREYHPHVPHPYPSQATSGVPGGSPSIDMPSSATKKNIFGKLFKRKGGSAASSPDPSASPSLYSTPSPSMSSPTPKPQQSEVSPPLVSPSLTSPMSPDATTPTMPSTPNMYINTQHLDPDGRQHHRVPSAPVPSMSTPQDNHKLGLSEGSGETPTPRSKRQAPSFNLPGIIGKGSAFMGRGVNPNGGRKTPSPVPPPLPPRDHAPHSEDSTQTATNGSRTVGSRSTVGDTAKRDSGIFGAPTDSSGSINVHHPPTPTQSQSQLAPAPVQALRPPVLGIQPALSVVPVGSKAARAVYFSACCNTAFSTTSQSAAFLENPEAMCNRIALRCVGQRLGVGKEEDRRRSGLREESESGSNWNMFEVRFEWKRGKSSKSAKRKGREREDRRSSLVIGNPPPPRDRANRSSSRHASRNSLPASKDAPEGDDSKDKASKRLSLVSHKSVSTSAGGSDEQRPDSGRKPRSQSRPRRKDSRLDDEDEEDDGEESDPEDSETPWTCTLKVKRVTPQMAGDGNSLLLPLTQTASRSPRSSAYSRGSLDLQNPAVVASVKGGSSQTLRLKLGTLSPTPHHPKVVAMLKVPFPLSDVNVGQMIVRKRPSPGGLGQPDLPPRPATSAGGERSVSEFSNSGLVLTAEELKDVFSDSSTKSLESWMGFVYPEHVLRPYHHHAQGQEENAQYTHAQSISQPRPRYSAMKWWPAAIPTEADHGEYELIPSDERSRQQRRRERRRIRPAYVFIASACLLCSSIVLFTVDFFRLRAPRPSNDAGWLDFFKKLWPVGLPDVTDNWQNENNKAMHALMSCMVNRTCKENQTSIVLLSSEHFSHSIAGHVSGEDIWAISVLISLQEMGYTTIYAPKNEELARSYRRFPDLVKAVILEGADSKRCFDDPKCIKTLTHPLGVPVWKMFSFHFWTGAEHPLGNRWTLSPENYPVLAPGNSKDNFYLGYSIERTCVKKPFIPGDDRPMQAYILAKQLSYFTNKNYMWKGVSLVPPFPLDLVAGMRNDTKGPSSIPDGINNLGQLNQQDFYEQLSKSRVLIGIGNPRLSPSPYDALCMGVPFINPIFNWNRDDPLDRNSWETQHDGLKFQEPPYVYHVQRDDGEGLWAAVKEAMNHPIPRYIVPDMSMDALKYRLGVLVEGDWKTPAEEILRERKATGKGKVRPS
ncbi:hypothetical protein EYR40_010329 [Pleurotus pulmonarius]|nr:hypothetical protein EYR40_010329 [Pleurotus pulmonarius]